MMMTTTTIWHVSLQLGQLVILREVLRSFPARNEQIIIGNYFTIGLTCVIFYY